MATVEDGDDDLLGGDFSQANIGGQEMSGFESSFPAIDTTNDVSNALLPCSLHVLPNEGCAREHCIHSPEAHQSRLRALVYEVNEICTAY